MEIWSKVVILFKIEIWPKKRNFGQKKLILAKNRNFSQKSLRAYLICRIIKIYKYRFRSLEKVEVRACQELPAVQIRLFWRFEFCCAFIGALSAYFTFFRMKQLDRENDERIQKQLSSL